jgi:hypothetical protein
VCDATSAHQRNSPIACGFKQSQVADKSHQNAKQAIRHISLVCAETIAHQVKSTLTKISLVCDDTIAHQVKSTLTQISLVCDETIAHQAKSTLTQISLVCDETVAHQAKSTDSPFNLGLRGTDRMLTLNSNTSKDTV